MRVLLVKLSSLGDVVQTLPVINDILKSYPEALIDWVVEESFADLLKRVIGLQRVIACPQRRLRKTWWQADSRAEWRQFTDELRQEAYDVVLDLQGLIKSAWVARSARLAPSGFTATYDNASDQCAFEWPVRWMLDRTFPMAHQIHAVTRYRTLAACALGRDPKSLALPIYPFQSCVSSRRQGLFLAHGTTRPDNEWPDEAWLTLARLWLQEHDRIWLPHANDRELARVQAWAEQIGPAAQVLPRMPLSQMVGHVGRSEAMVTVDSGLGHLGVALGLPLVMIFSQPRINRAGPQGGDHQIAVGGDAPPPPSVVWDSLLLALARQP